VVHRAVRAGKSTISNIIETRLRAAGAKVELLDGDIVRTISRKVSASAKRIAIQHPAHRVRQ